MHLKFQRSSNKAEEQVRVSEGQRDDCVGSWRDCFRDVTPPPRLILARAVRDDGLSRSYRLLKVSLKII